MKMGQSSLIYNLSNQKAVLNLPRSTQFQLTRKWQPSHCGITVSQISEEMLLYKPVQWLKSGNPTIALPNDKPRNISQGKEYLYSCLDKEIKDQIYVIYSYMYSVFHDTSEPLPLSSESSILLHLWYFTVEAYNKSITLNHLARNKSCLDELLKMCGI